MSQIGHVTPDLSSYMPVVLYLLKFGTSGYPKAVFVIQNGHKMAFLVVFGHFLLNRASKSIFDLAGPTYHLLVSL